MDSSVFLSRSRFVRGAIAERYGHADHRLRGQLAVSMVLGMALSRYILRLPALVSVSDDEIAELLGPAMQQVLVDGDAEPDSPAG